jgi:guanylate kinase
LNSSDHRFSGQEEGLYLVVSAPSGAGKTTICKRILSMFPNIKYSVSYTTRPPRPEEEDGRDYHFVSQECFQDRIAKGGFAEWSENFGYLYGTSLDAMKDHLQHGFDLMLDVEPQGAKAIKKNYPGGAFIFIMPPSMDELEKRLINRGFESSENMLLRINQAKDMMKEYDWYDYVIFNDNLSDAVDCFRSIYIAEKSRRARWEGRVSHLLKTSPL